MQRLISLSSVKRNFLGFRFKIRRGGYVKESYTSSNMILQEFLLTSVVKPRKIQINFAIGRILVYQLNQTCFTRSQASKGFLCKITNTIAFRDIFILNGDKHKSVVVRLRTQTRYYVLFFSAKLLNLD